MNREIEFFGSLDKLVLPPYQLLSLPGRYGAFIKTKPLVGYDKIGIDAQYLAESLTGRAGAKRIIKGEKIGNRLFEDNAVHFKFVGEKHPPDTIDLQLHFPFTLIK